MPMVGKRTLDATEIADARTSLYRSCCSSSQRYWIISGNRLGSPGDSLRDFTYDSIHCISQWLCPGCVSSSALAYEELFLMVSNTTCGYSSPSPSHIFGPSLTRSRRNAFSTSEKSMHTVNS